MKTCFLIYFFCILNATAKDVFTNFQFKIYGLNKELRKNVYIKINNIIQKNHTNYCNLKKKINNAIIFGLKPFGYYHPVVKFSYKTSETFFSKILIIKIDPGKPILVKDITIKMLGSLKYDQDYKKMLAFNISKRGKILNHLDYENLKEKLYSLAMQKGYFDSKMNKSELKISLKNHFSYWLLEFNSGNRYKFGKTYYIGSQILKKYLNNIKPFKRKEYFSFDKLSEFNKRLIDTGWFSSVIVTPDINKAQKIKSNILPISVILIPKLQNHIEFGGEYTKDSGFRIKSIWNIPWIDSIGKSFYSTMNFSTQEKTLDLVYKIPILKSPLEEYYLLNFFYKNIRLKKEKFKEGILNISKNWDYYKGWQYSIGLKWNINNLIEKEKNNITIYPYISFNKIYGEEETMPNFAEHHNHIFHFSNKFFFSNINFINIQSKNVWIQTPIKKHRLILKTYFNLIKSYDLKKVPLEIYFFFNKNNTRFFNNQNTFKIYLKKKNSIFNVNFSSIEYQYNIFNKWWIATFFDFHSIINNFDKKKIKIKSGIGLRWAWFFKPIKIDIVIPLKEFNFRRTQFYIGIDSEL